MASLLLLRHGRIRANRQGRWHGSTDSEPDWRGRREIRRTARHVAAEHPDLAAIYSSPLRRCRQTAESVGRRLGLTPQLHDDLREYDLGEWEDMRFADLALTHDFFERIASDPDFAPPGGESLRAVAIRTAQALTEIEAAHTGGGRVLVVGHGAALGAALGQLLGGDPARWTEYQVANCSLTELVLSPTPYVNFFNATGHL
ncbi:MAG: histidine phosphatase family protein [Pseudomonadales bacterium]